MLAPAVTLSASELRYRRLFEAAPDGILIVDLETRQIVDVNPFLVEFLGYSRDELLGKEPWEFGLFPDDEIGRTAFEELHANGFLRYDDLPLRTKHGRPVVVEFVSNLYQEGDQQIVQCSIRDITARKEVESALRATELKLAEHAAEMETLVGHRTAELQLSNTQLEAFVYSIAHDLRAPLRTMQGFAELLVREYAANLPPQGRDFANFINQAAQTMDHLLADLLAFSQLSQQKIELVPVPLETAVQSALAGCEEEIVRTKAQIESVPPWPVVLAHPTTLRQVLVNLISNALKFVPAGAPPQVRIRAEARPEEFVRLWIEDNGIGIPPEFHERIFQVFQRLHTPREYPGTGIGLAIVQKGLERMRGRAGVESSPGAGSRFWIELAGAPAGLNSPRKGKEIP
jgi:PAS domain S-box-containing protein